jgi:large subunit ribosomal protein L35
VPKMKTHSGAKKRMKLTGRGKLRAFHAKKRHILTKKKPKQRGRLGGGMVLGKGDAKNLHDVLPYG